MTAPIMIRMETVTDIASIEAVTLAAFANHPYSHQTEHFILRSLRKANSLSLSLVAEVDGQVVGNVAFSPVSFADATPHWYGVGPLSVLPEKQRQGIGKRLMIHGITLLQNQGAHGFVLVGSSDYYQHFGFKAFSEIQFPGIPPEFVLSLCLNGPMPKGVVKFHPAFEATA